MQTINGLLILGGLALFIIGAGVVACLHGWLAIAAGRSLGNAQMDLLRRADAERKALLAAEAKENPPPRPSALNFVATRSGRPK